MDESLACPVCRIEAADLAALAAHLVEQAEASDGTHVMWLNRNATKHRTSASELELLLADPLADRGSSSDRIRR